MKYIILLLTLLTFDIYAETCYNQQTGKNEKFRIEINPSGKQYVFTGRSNAFYFKCTTDNWHTIISNENSITNWIMKVKTEDNYIMTCPYSLTCISTKIHYKDYTVVRMLFISYLYTKDEKIYYVIEERI